MVNQGNITTCMASILRRTAKVLEITYREEAPPTFLLGLPPVHGVGVDVSSGGHP